jgi:hypothetical protein
MISFSVDRQVFFGFFNYCLGFIQELSIEASLFNYPFDNILIGFYV